MQKKAMAIFLFGILLTFPWAALLFGVVAISPVLVIPESPAAWAVAVAIIFAPGLIVGGLALKLPKMTTIKCSKCKWKVSVIA